MVVKTFEGLWCLLLVMIVFLSCRTEKSVKTTSKADLKYLEEIEAGNFQCKSNKAETYNLCLSTQPDKVKAGQNVNKAEIKTILLISIRNDEIIFVERIKGGTAKWIDSNNVEIFYPSGVPGKHKVMIYNIEKREKTEKNIPK